MQSLFFYIWRMLARWCISILIFLLTLFGVVLQHQVVTPNQEIVLEFADVMLTSEDATQTVLVVKQQLKALGAEHIQVKKIKNGHLKISYYSRANISIIKALFRGDGSIALNYQSKSTNNESSDSSTEGRHIAYHIDVYEIQSGSDSGWGFEGTSSLEVRVKSDRFLDPNSASNTVQIASGSLKLLVSVAFKVSESSSIILDKLVHSIPEVRAGPFS